MKPNLFAPVVRAAALLVAFACSFTVLAAPDDGVTASENDPPSVDLNRLTEAEALQFAYLVLLPGNHNYNGHRGKAMDEISAAATAFGLELKERGKGKEDQKKSDARLRLAYRILEQTRAKLTGEDQKESLRHIDRALRHLVIALEIRALEDDRAEAGS